MDWSSCIQGKDVATLSCIPIIFQNLVNFAFVLVGALAVGFIIYSGIKFITSGGDPKQVEEARKIMTYAIIGLIVVIASFAIINFIADITGAQCIKIFGFTSCQ